jgi:heme-degrading monooxygenase HmoA
VSRWRKDEEVVGVTEPFASGSWYVMQGKENEFVDRWTEFLTWTRKTQPALVEASLIRDEHDARHFISFARWQDAGARNAWKESPEFMERFTACRSLCEDFQASDYGRLVAI